MTLFETDWRTSMQDVSAAIDDEFGEPVTVTPTRLDKPNFPRVPQPDEAVTVVAVFSNKAKTILGGNEHKFSSMRISPLVETSEPVFSFGYTVLPWPLLQGYLIMLHRTGETYEVTNVKPDGVSRIIAPVVQFGRSREGAPPTDNPRIPMNVMVR